MRKLKDIIYHNTHCGICGKKITGAVNCQRDRANICMEQCYKVCEYFINDGCRYGSKESKRRADIEAFKKRQREKHPIKDEMPNK